VHLTIRLVLLVRLVTSEPAGTPTEVRERADEGVAFGVLAVAVPHIDDFVGSVETGRLVDRGG